MFSGLYHYHESGMAYKHLHPENILIQNGHAALRHINDQCKCSIGYAWPFDSLNVANPDHEKPADMYNFGLLVLWMACKGAGTYNTAVMKFYCNVALIKMTMATDPNHRPQIDSIVYMDNPVFRYNVHWRGIPLKDFMNEVSTKHEVEACDLTSEVETGDSTSGSECVFHPCTEDESGNETTESEAAPRRKFTSKVNEVDIEAIRKELTTLEIAVKREAGKIKLTNQDNADKIELSSQENADKIELSSQDNADKIELTNQDNEVHKIELSTQDNDVQDDTHKIELITEDDDVVLEDIEDTEQN